MAGMTPLTRRRYRRLLRHLRADCPPQWPVVIRWHKKLEDGGDCWFDKKRRWFVIRLDKKLAHRRADLIDILIHEWAHCLAWVEGAQDHGPEWGVADSRCYCIW